MNTNIKYLVIDDVLENPQETIELAKELDFFSSETKNPMNRNGDKWRGHRSLPLNVDSKKKVLQEILNKILEKINFYSFVNSKECHTSIDFQTNAFFHYTTKEYRSVKNKEWIHTDPHFLYSGVLYLGEFPEKNSGTILFDGQKEIVVENKFNRLAFYRSDMYHSAQNGFGDSIDNSRLVFLFFIEKFSFNIQNVYKHSM